MKVKFYGLNYFTNHFPKILVSDYFLNTTQAL